MQIPFCSTALFILSHSLYKRERFYIEDKQDLLFSVKTSHLKTLTCWQVWPLFASLLSIVNILPQCLIIYSSSCSVPLYLDESLDLLLWWFIHEKCPYV